MESQDSTESKKGGISKGLIITIIAILLIGGGVAAYMSLANSPKATYFSAEKDNLEYISDKMEERMETESKWYEFTEKNAIDSTFNLSGTYNDPFGGGEFDAVNPEEIINSSVFTINSQYDLENKELSTSLLADIAGIEFKDINLFMTDEEITVQLPFLDDLLQIKGDDIGPFLHELDPLAFPADTEYNLGDIFDYENTVFSEEDLEYLREEYLDYIYKELDDDAFAAEDEEIEIAEDSIKAEKLTLHLDEEEIKELLSSLLDKAKEDDKLKGMIKKQFTGAGPTAQMVTDMADEIMAEYENTIEDIKTEVNDELMIPDGLTSTIWVDKDRIVKRDFEISMGWNESELVTSTINGTQILEDDYQSFNYDLGFKDAYNDEVLTILGDLSYIDDKIEDSIKLQVAGFEIGYTADETLKDGKRDFERIFTASEEAELGRITWSGDSEYEKDNMNSEHDVTLDIADMPQEIAALNIVIDSKKIKEVDLPEDENIKDIGSMSAAELEEYIDGDASEQFENWLFQIMGSFGGSFGF